MFCARTLSLNRMRIAICVRFVDRRPGFFYLREVVPPPPGFVEALFISYKERKDRAGKKHATRTSFRFQIDLRRLNFEKPFVRALSRADELIVGALTASFFFCSFLSLSFSARSIILHICSFLRSSRERAWLFDSACC